MTTTFKSLGLGLATLAGLTQIVSAVDITVFDQRTYYRANLASNGWWGDTSLNPGVQHPDSRGIAEDNETEPGTAIGQQWDLEAFQIHGTTLSLIGGFNFLAGEGTYASGDIFIDVDGDATWGTPVGGGQTSIQSNALFRYDYVIDLQQTLTSSHDSAVSSIGTRYTVYRLDEASDQVISVAFAGHAAANPWIYHSGGEAVEGHTDRPLTSGLYLGGEYAGFEGNNTHHLLTFDLSFLGNHVPDGTLFKFTMECGNDNLVGRYSQHVPDTGGTVTMLAGSLIALGSLRLRTSPKTCAR